MPRRKTDPEERRRSLRQGHRAEWLAAQFLRLKGYRLLDRNVRTPYGEVDLVLRRDKTVIFAEVKRRAGGAHAGAAVGWQQRQRISRAAQHLAGLRQYGQPQDGIRIDLILLQPGRLPEHVVDAWRP